MDRYSQTRLSNPESVLEHTGWVCMCSFFIGMELKSFGEEIDMGLLMSKAVIHDVEEVIVGDIANPTKYYSSALTQQIHSLSEHAAGTLLSPFESGKQLFDLWVEAKYGKEGYIVALADKLAVVYKVHQEVVGFGNSTIKDHVKGLEEALHYLDGEMGLSEIENTFFIRNTINEALELCKEIT